MRLFLSLSAGLAGLLLAVPALARSSGPGTTPTSPAPTPDFNADRITIAVGAAYLPDYLGSNDYRFVPAPAVIGSIKHFNFTLIGNRVSLDLIRDRPDSKIDLQFGPVAEVDFNRTSTSRIHDPRIKALGSLGTAIELGGYVGIGKTGVITSDYDKLSVSVSARHDVANVYNGEVFTPSINYLTPLSRTAAVGFFGSADYGTGRYARAYFGITPVQSVRSGLPAYTPRAGWEDYTVGALATVSITGDLLHGFSIVGGGTYSRMLNDFGNSPVTSIAGSRNQWIGAVGVAYTF